MIRQNNTFNNTPQTLSERDQRLAKLRAQMEQDQKMNNKLQELNKTYITKAFVENKPTSFTVSPNTSEEETKIESKTDYVKSESSSVSDDVSDDVSSDEDVNSENLNKSEEEIVFAELNSSDIKHNLKIIRDLKKGRKLCFSVEGRRLDIESSWLPSVSRRWRNIGREKIVNFIEHNTKHAFRLLDGIINKDEINLSEIDKSTYNNGQLLNDIKYQLRDSVNGLEEMKKTYKGDSNVITQVDNIIDSIEQKIQNVNEKTGNV
jgi:hypothetical protein